MARILTHSDSPESKQANMDKDHGDPKHQLQEHITDESQVDTSKSETGTWKAAYFIYAINFADFLANFSVIVNLVPYLAMTMHQPLSKAANISTNFTGTGYLIAVLGGFIADSYLGSFKTIVIGNVAMCLGLGLLTFSTAYSGLQPAPCTPGPTTQCSPAGTRFMAPLYLALYAIALGTGLVKPTAASLGADQFDDSSPAEKKQGVHFFVWFYFSSNVALIIAFSLGVYLQDDVSRSWGYGFALIVYALCSIVLYLGARKLRHKRPAGSFLTRTAQVLVAAVRKRNIALPEDVDQYCDYPLPGSLKIPHTNELRFLDKAAVMEGGVSDDASKARYPWRLVSVSQVEETKRLVQVIPIWMSTWMVCLVFSQLTTFTVQQGQTFDRRLGPHFVVPPASLSTILALIALVEIPIYDHLLIPFVRRFTKHPYGFKTLQRLGASIFFAVFTMITAALVERKRLTVVRRLHLEELPLGAYVLPFKMWWLLPQFFLAAQVEIFLYVSSYQFFYHEASEGTRSIGSSFTYSASAMGFYFSTVIVDIVNKATRHNKSGSWLEGQLNDGGLEKFYWLLAVLLAVNFLIYLACAHWYRYKYDWYHRNVTFSQVRDHNQQFPSGDSKQDGRSSLASMD